MSVIGDLSGFTQVQPPDQRLFGSWLNLLSTRRQRSWQKKALNGSGLAENMRRNGRLPVLNAPGPLFH
jgi:hypothetical protein